MGIHFQKNLILKLSILFFVPLIFARCEVGPEDKFIIETDGPVTISYNLKGTSDVKEFAISDEAQITLTNAASTQITLAFTGKSGSGEFQILPGLNVEYLLTLDTFKDSTKTPEQNRQAAELYAYGHATGADYKLSTGGGGIFPVNSNQPINFEGKIKTATWDKKTGQDSPPYDSAGLGNLINQHSLNQFKSKDANGPINVVIRNVSTAPESGDGGGTDAGPPLTVPNGDETSVEKASGCSLNLRN